MAAPLSSIPDIIVADRLSIVRIFRNIIENSLKYGGDGLGKIEIDYRSTDNLHIFTVTDDGQGLTAQGSINIFNWFQRVKQAQQKPMGPGWDWPLSRSLQPCMVEKFGRNQPKPKGVAFCFSLSRHLIPMEESGQD